MVVEVALTTQNSNSLGTKLYLNCDSKAEDFLQPSPSKSKRALENYKKSENTIATSGLDKANLLNITFTNHYNRSVPELSIF